MADYLGDIAEDTTIRGSFNTRDAAGAPITLAGSPTLAVYKDAGTTESTAGVTLTVDFDTRTGHHIFAIDTAADAFYAIGSDYRVVITTGTVDSVSVVGVEVGAFSIQNRFMRGTDGANTVVPPTVSDIITAAGSNAATHPLERNIGDTNPVTFQWVTDDATITAQRSLNNASYEDVTGAVAFLRSDGAKHLYTLAYNAADRPAANGIVRYAFTDGTYTRYISLRVSGANTVVPPTVAAFEARTLPSAEYGTSEQLTNLESARLPRLS